MKAIIVGALGVMGGYVIDAVNQSGGECVALVDIKHGNDRASNEYTKIADVKESADVIIDFSFHGLTSEITDFAQKTGKRTPKNANYIIYRKKNCKKINFFLSIAFLF